MIVPMEKLSLLIFHKDYQTFLGALRERGVVHVHENKKKTAEDEQLKQKLVLIKRIGEMLRLLGKRQQETESIVPEEKGAELLQRLENSYKRQEQIEQQLTALKKDGILYEPWGTFSKERIDELGKAGWEMRFFTVPDRKYMPEWEEKYNAFVINQEKGQKYFVTFIPKDTEVSLEADAVVFPQLTAEEIQKESEELKAEKEQLEHYLNQVAASAATALRDYRLEVYEDTDELKIEGAARKVLDDKVIAIEGWVPEKLRPEMEQWLSDKGVYYGFEKPELTDNPRGTLFPTQLPGNRPYPVLCAFLCVVFRLLPGGCGIRLTPSDWNQHLQNQGKTGTPSDIVPGTVAGWGDRRHGNCQRNLFWHTTTGSSGALGG